MRPVNVARYTGPSAPCARYIGFAHRTSVGLLRFGQRTDSHQTAVPIATESAHGFATNWLYASNVISFAVPDKTDFGSTEVVALHGPEEPRSTALLIDALMAKVYNQRASHFANRTQSTDEATEYQNGLPAYREADRILSEALSKFPNDVHVLRRVLSNSLPSTRDLQVKFVILKRLVIADKTNFVAHISLVRVAMLIGDMSTARGASINMLRRMLLLGDADLPLVPFDVTVGNLSGDFRDEGGACPDLSNALGADFALMPEQFHTRPDSAVGPEHFKDAADRTAKLTSLREMLKKMIDNFSTSTCGAHR